MAKILLILLFFVFIAPQVQGQDCNSLLRKDFASWNFDEEISKQKFKAEDFLPQSFVDKFTAQGKKLKVLSDAQNNGSVHSFKILTDDDFVVAEWQLWQGSQKDRVVIEKLRLQSPPYLLDGIKHQSQEAKGLPYDVFLHARTQIFSYLRKGNFTSIEISGSQDYVVFNLYKRLVGAESETEMGKKFTDHLKKVYRLTREGELFPDPIESVEDFAKLMGNYYQEPVPSYLLRNWNEAIKAGKIGTIEGATPIMHEGKLIALRVNTFGNEAYTVLINPFSTEEPIITWKSIHKTCSECVRMIAPLN